MRPNTPKAKAPMRDLVTPAQAAEILAVSPRTVDRLSLARCFPRYRVGGRIRYCKQDLYQYIESCRYE